MKKVLKWAGIAFLILVVIGMIQNYMDDASVEKAAMERYNKQNASIQACVKTLGEGVNSYKSLSWKLDNCNASK